MTFAAQLPGIFAAGISETAIMKIGGWRTECI
jgi:hypothetical protein